MAKKNAGRGARAAGRNIEKNSQVIPDKQKKRKYTIALPAAAVLVVLALAAGSFAGFMYSRNSLEKAKKQLEETRQKLEIMTQNYMEASKNDDYFAAELDDSALEELNDLAGERSESVGAEVLNEVRTVDLYAGSNGGNTVVAQFEGGVVTAEEAQEAYNEMVSDLLFDGYTEDNLPSGLMQSVLESLAAEKTALLQAEKTAGEPGAETQAQLQEEAKQRFADQVEFLMDFLREGNMTDEEARQATQQYLEENEGTRYEDIYQEMVREWQIEQVFNEVTKDITVTDQEVEAQYYDLLADQKDEYEKYPEDFEFAKTDGDAIVYNLPGYRCVRILSMYINDDTAIESIIRLQDELSALDETEDAERAQEIRKQLDGYFTKVESDGEKALSLVKSGMSLEEIANNYGSSAEVEVSYISAKSILWDDEIINAAIALTGPGSVSDVVRYWCGVCLIEYIEDVPEGPVALEDAYEMIRTEVLQNKKNEAFETQKAIWLQAANPVYYPERMQ